MSSLPKSPEVLQVSGYRIKLQYHTFVFLQTTTSLIDTLHTAQDSSSSVTHALYPTTSPSVVPTQSTGKEDLTPCINYIGVNELVVVLVVMALLVISVTVGLRKRNKHVIISVFDTRKIKVGVSLEASHTFSTGRIYYDIDEESFEHNIIMTSKMNVRI